MNQGNTMFIQMGQFHYWEGANQWKNALLSESIHLNQETNQMSQQQNFHSFCQNLGKWQGTI